MRPLLVCLACSTAACAPSAIPSQLQTAPPPVAAEPAPIEVPVLSPRPALRPPEPAQMEAPEPPESGPELPAAPYLVDGVAGRFPRRALLGKNGPLRFSLGGDPANHAPAQDLPEPLSGIVVEEHPRSLRMVLADEHVRLAVYVRRDALRQVAVASTWLSPVAGRAPNPTAGVRVAPGVLLDEKERQGALRKVSGEVDRIRFEGWLPEEAVGTVYAPARFPAPEGNVLLAEGTAITAPGGEVLARLPGPANPAAPPGFYEEATLLPGAPAGMNAVHLRRSSLEVRGLVPAAAVRKKPPGGGHGMGWIGGVAGGMTDTEHLLLRAGAGLYTAKGARVGVALRPTEVWVSYGARQSKEPLVWAGFLFSTFGFLDARVNPGDLRALPGR